MLEASPHRHLVVHESRPDLGVLAAHTYRQLGIEREMILLQDETWKSVMADKEKDRIWIVELDPRFVDMLRFAALIGAILNPGQIRELVDKGVAMLKNSEKLE